jgi:hypothetical protein
MSQAIVRCPSCTKHAVEWIKLRGSGALVCVCPCCEMTWLTPDDIGAAPPLSLTRFLEGQGLPDDWWELKRVGAITRSA